MLNSKPKRHAAADVTGWLLGTIIAVLAVLDLLIWATLWNVPNPMSKALAPQAATSARPAAEAASPFAGTDAKVQPAMLHGDGPAAWSADFNRR